MLIQVTEDALEALRKGFHPIDRFVDPDAPRPNALFQGHILTVSELGDKESVEAVKIKTRLQFWLEKDGYWRLKVEERTPDGRARVWHEKEPYMGPV